MSRKNSFLLVFFYFLAETSGQFAGGWSSCREFTSPMKLVAQGSKVGSIKLPLSGGRYHRDQLCEWRIDTDDKSKVIRLQVKSSSIEGVDLGGECNRDYVDIFDYVNNENKFVGRFCGAKSGQLYDTTGQTMIVRFYSNANFEFGGFSAQFQAVTPVTAPSTSNFSLKAGIGCGVGTLAFIVLLLILIWAIRRHYAKRKQQNNAQNIPAEGRIVASTSRRSFSANPSQFGDRRFLPATDSQPLYARTFSDLDHDHVTLQVAMPSAEGSYQYDTPPPAYDSLGYDPPSNMGPDGLPLTPPPYETAIKESMGQSGSNTH